MDLRTAVRSPLRRAAEWALARDYPTAERAMTGLFRDAAPLPLADMAGVEYAGVLAERFPERPMRLRRLTAAARDAGAAPLAIVGDSHSTHLVRSGRRGGRWLLPLHLLCTGASARGLANPEAAAGAGARVAAFLALLATAPPMPVVFKFGQVDLEFVFPFKRLEAGETRFDPGAFEAFGAETIERYLAFLSEATPAALRPLARIAGVFPPALSDAAWAQGYVNAHIAALHGPADAALLSRLAELEIPSLPERTRLHAAFNARLFAAAKAEGFGVLDGFSGLLGPDGVVARRLLGPARGANHHLGYGATRAPMTALAWEAAISP